MEPLLLLFTVGVLALLGIRAFNALNAGREPPHEVEARLRAAWHHLAARFSLVEHHPLFEVKEENLESRGTIEGFPVVLRTRQDSWIHRHAVLAARVTLDPALPSDVAIRLRGLVSPLRREALAAIASIQERATGAAPGQLALTESPGGEISLVPSGAGTLGLAAPESATTNPMRPSRGEPSQ